MTAAAEAHHATGAPIAVHLEMGTGALPDAVRALAEAGFGHRLLLGGDTVVAGARSVDGGPGMPYLLRRVRPRLALELGEELMNRVLTENPGRAFAVEWR